MLMEMPKVGEKVRVLNSNGWGRLVEGQEYEVTEVSGVYFDLLDDFGRYDICASMEFASDFELVTESAPDVRDLLANLGRRLSEVERTVPHNRHNAALDFEVIYEDLADLKAGKSSEIIVEEQPQDAVNSPQHYKRGKFETIEVIEHITAGYDDPFVAYCVGNAVKYLDRAPYKHDSPAECLRKAAWYITRAAEHTEASE